MVATHGSVAVDRLAIEMTSEKLHLLVFCEIFDMYSDDECLTTFLDKPIQVSSVFLSSLKQDLAINYVLVVR